MLDPEVRDNLARARSGDRGALYALLTELERPLWFYALRMIREVAGAEDLIQETWLRVLRGIGAFEIPAGAPPGAAFAGWVYRIASNLQRDRVRRKRPEVSLDRPLSGDDVREFRDLLPDLGRLPEAEFDRRVEAEAVRRALEALPDEQREVVVLRIYGGLAFAEIARIQECPLNTALGRMHYAFQTLRKGLRSLAPEGSTRNSKR